MLKSGCCEPWPLAGAASQLLAFVPWAIVVVFCCGRNVLFMLVLLLAEDVWNTSNLKLIVSGCS